MIIERLNWRPANLAELAAHGVGQGEVEGLIALDAWVALRHPSYPDQVRVIGPTPNGRFLTIVMEPNDIATAWRPVTGWPSTAAELAYHSQENR
jgi:hypothetical protein